MIDVRESAKFIVEHAAHVSIDEARIKEIARGVVSGKYATPQEMCVLPFVGKNPEETLQFYLALDAINFCFWSETGEQGWEIESEEGQWVHGYRALVGAMARPIKNQSLSFEPEQLKQLDFDRVKQILGGRGEIPLLRERQEALVEIGEGLLGDSVLGLIEESGRSAIPFLDAIISRFPSFRDEAEYNGRQVGFYKRAQLLVSDLSLALEAHRLAPLTGLSRLTVFADYRLPQLLRHEGALVYEVELARFVDHQHQIPCGSPMETEIRGGTILASELLRANVNNLGLDMTSSQLDNILWTEAKRRENEMAPHHKTLTIFY